MEVRPPYVQRAADRGRASSPSLAAAWQGGRLPRRRLDDLADLVSHKTIRRSLLRAVRALARRLIVAHTLEILLDQGELSAVVERLGRELSERHDDGVVMIAVLRECAVSG